MTPWKSAGVRYTDEEWDARQREHTAENNRLVAQAEAHEVEGYRSWAAGHLVPAMITYALDSAGLQGEHVDVQLGAQEPDVDHWEAGILYPTWEQTRKLAAATGVGYRMLCVQPLDPGQVFICGRGLRSYTPPPPVRQFTQQALAERLHNTGVGGLW